MLLVTSSVLLPYVDVSDFLITTDHQQFLIEHYISLGIIQSLFSGRSNLTLNAFQDGPDLQVQCRPPL